MNGATTKAVQPVSTGSWIPRSLSIAIAIAAVVILLLSVAKACSPKSATMLTRKYTRDVRALVHGASQSALSAEQDVSPIMALMHADYALTQARTARSLSSAELVQKWCDIPIDDFIERLEAIQGGAIRAIHDSCPALQSTSAFAANAGWITI